MRPAVRPSRVWQLQGGCTSPSSLPPPCFPGESGASNGNKPVYLVHDSWQVTITSPNV